MRTVSLFSGAGGMDIGAINAGSDIVAAVEIDTHACDTYRYNHPTTQVIEGDINEKMDEITNFQDIDIVIGGPPCQGFSVAGKMDINDPRSKLVFSFCDTVEKLKPKAFIMENVKSLGSLSKFSCIREEIIKRMTKAGYHVSMSILNAKDFGVPQSRERVFFIGVLNQYKPISQFEFNNYKKEAISLRQAIVHLGKAGTTTNPNVTKAKITLATKPVLRKSPYAGMLFNGQGRPLNPDSWASTLPATMGGNRTPIIDEDHLYDGKASWVEEHHKKLIDGTKKAEYGNAPERLRRLTIDEAAILQTFPQGYEFKGPQTSVFNQIGNAVPCRLAEVVTKVVINALKHKNSTKTAKQTNYELTFN